MKTDADEIIAQTRDHESSESAYRKASIQIFCAMRPKFGPANAWLFNERASKLELLSEAMNMDRNLLTPKDQVYYEEACTHLEHILLILRDLGYDTEVRPGDRRALLWTFAEGFTLVITDGSRTVPWIPPYSEPSTAEQNRHPQLTLYLFPPYEGKAEQHLARREQPGLPVFYTGALMGFTLQPAQSGDVAETTIYKRVISALTAEDMFSLSTEAFRQKMKGQVNASGVRNGLPWVVNETVPESENLPALDEGPLLWSHGTEATRTHQIINP